MTRLSSHQNSLKIPGTNNTHRIATSPIFTFLIGRDKTEFRLHVAAVAHVSKPLGVLMTGPMKEAAEQRVWLDDVDKETFARFAQFVYTGTYTPAQPNDREPKLDDEKAETWDEVEVAKRIEWVTSMKAETWEGFECMEYPVPDLSMPSSSGEGKSEDYSPVFLSHVKMYIFADKYNIILMQSLSLQKQHTAFCSLDSYKTCASAIVKVLHYSYEHTTPTETEPLRKLLSRHMAYEIDSMLKNADFRSMLVSHSMFSRDLVCAMAENQLQLEIDS